MKTTELKVINDDLPAEEFYAIPETLTSFELDFQGVKTADALVFIAAEKPRKYNGAAVELGIALGDGIPCFQLGALENSVLYAPVTRCMDPQDLVTRLQEVQR